jgi:pimeloyl-ACP methyl ester carboxylesterase
MTRTMTIFAATALLLAACRTGDPVPGTDPMPSSPTTTTPATTDAAAPTGAYVDVGGYELFIACRGSGSPTVVFEAGLGGDNSSFFTVDAEVSTTTTTCGYDRAGIGSSDERPASDSPATAGEAADELDRLLAGAGIEGSIVLVGHSFGGMVEQLYADRHPERVAGLVFVDTAMAGQLTPADRNWEEAPGVLIDMRRTKRELEGVGSYGATPMVVLTQAFVGEADVPASFQRLWPRLHDQLAANSNDSVHLIAVGSGHFIQEDEPDLVIAAIEEVLASVRDGQPLAPCDGRFADAGGKCVV